MVESASLRYSRQSHVDNLRKWGMNPSPLDGYQAVYLARTKSEARAEAKRMLEIPKKGRLPVGTKLTLIE